MTTTSPSALGLPPVKKPRKPRRWLRTRDREHLQLLNLQLDINALYSEIQSLQVTRSLLQARALYRHDAPDGSYIRMVHEYFSKLRHGYADPREYPAMVPAHRFLHSMLDQDVSKGHLRGIAMCIKSIAMYTAAFGPVVHQLVSASVQLNPDADTDQVLANGHNTVLVRAKSKYTTTIVPATFAIVFPHAPKGLQEILMGKSLEGYGQFDIVFDTVSNRVVRFDIEFDFLPAFAAILPDPRDLAMLFSGALVATDCTIGDDAATSAPPLEVVNDEVEILTPTDNDDEIEILATTDNDDASSTLSSPGKASPSPYRSMAIESLLNEEPEEESY